MKTLELTEKEFDFVGSIFGNHITGWDPSTNTVFRKLCWLKPDGSFPALDIDESNRRPGCLHLKRPEIGRVISYNVSVAENADLEHQIKNLIQAHGGTVISV